MRVLFLFVFLTFQCHAQMVLNDELSLDNGQVVFNPTFIKTHKIKSIQGRISVKKPMKPIRVTNRYVGYFFDEDGRISYSFETRNYNDTIFRRYFYNDKKRLIYQSVEEEGYLHYESYLWDEKGRVKSIEAFERKNDRMGIPYTESVKNESFDFKPCDTTCVKIVKNKVGTPYMKVESFQDEKGNVIREDHRYIVTNEGTIQYLTYDKNSRLIKKELVTSKQKLNKEAQTFSYDVLGNIKSKQDFKEGILQKETQVIVNENSGFLSAVIELEGNSSAMTITRFNSFSYFD